MQLVTSTTVGRWLIASAGGIALLTLTRVAHIGGEPRVTHDTTTRAAAQPSPDVWAGGYELQIWQLCTRDPDAAACSSDMARAVLEPPALELRPEPMLLDDGGLRAADRYRDVGMPRGQVLFSDRAADEAFRLSDGAERQLRRWLLRP